jgi:hypothetical protein
MGEVVEAKKDDLDFVTEAVFSKICAPLYLSDAIKYADECYSTEYYTRTPKPDTIEHPMSDIIKNYDLTEPFISRIPAWHIGFRHDANGVYFEAFFERFDGKDWDLPQFNFRFFISRPGEARRSLAETPSGCLGT